MSEPVTRTFLDLLAEKKDEEAYRFLYLQYYDTLLRFATAYLKAKEPAEEIVNDILYKVWFRKEAIAEINNLRVYLFTAVRNACLTLVAKLKREQDIVANVSFNIATADDPESLVISAELNSRIKNTINSLPPRCRQVYEMIRVEGLRNKDVAKQLNISINTIDVQLALALKRLIRTVNLFNQEKDLSKKI